MWIRGETVRGFQNPAAVLRGLAVTNPWTPDRRYSIITHRQATVAQIVDAKTFKELKRLTIGPAQRTSASRSTTRPPSSRGLIVR
jgi:hypothetical protein